MKPFYLITFIIFVFSSCTNKGLSFDQKDETNRKNQIISLEIQSLFDSTDVIGSVLIYDLQKDIYYSNDFEWANKGKLPASTFKIANSIIAFESGVVADMNTISIWDGKERWLKKWEQDLNFKDAFHFSCVPCFQDIARNIGEKRMKSYLKQFDYGNMFIDSTNIDNFWLEGNSIISQFQQIEFLKYFYNSQLSISKRTEDIMKKMMVIEAQNNYRISGKTGWSNDKGIDNGWFVGYIENGTNNYIFATNIEPKPQFDMKQFASIRSKLTIEALEIIGIIEPK